MNGATIDGHKPHVSMNTSRASGYRTSCNRGHFYNQCAGKKGTTKRLTNMEPGEAYGVKTQWVLDLYVQNKLDTPLAAAGIFRCVTPALEAQVQRSSVHANSVAREEFKQAHAAALLAMKLPYRTTGEDIDAINAWYSQYAKPQWRYKALVLWGDSQLAKTEYIKDRFPGVHIHKSVINWNSYNPAQHPAVLFDDVCGLWGLIVRNKVAFQANGSADFGGSATNCHLVTVDLLAKPLIICCNEKPFDDSWIGQNMHVVHIRHSLVDYPVDHPSYAGPSEPSVYPIFMPVPENIDGCIKSVPAYNMLYKT